MKKITNWDSLRQMWSTARTFDQTDYKLNKFDEGYCRYLGCGNHLYILVSKDHCEEKVVEIGSKRIHPKEMAKQLKDLLNEYRVIVVDVEMGGMSVYV